MVLSAHLFNLIILAAEFHHANGADNVRRAGEEMGIEILDACVFGPAVNTLVVESVTFFRSSATMKGNVRPL